jgi:hypothetical protein
MLFESNCTVESIQEGKLLAIMCAGDCGEGFLSADFKNLVTKFVIAKTGFCERIPAAHAVSPYL